MRKSIKLPRYDIDEFRESLSISRYPENLKLVNVRGCNGSGKSTIPLQLLSTDGQAFILTFEGRDRATVFPQHGFIAMGTYRTKTGGLDQFRNNAETFNVLEKLWKLPFSILMEGVISSTIFSTYANLFKELEKRNNPKRNIFIINLLPPLEVCLERIKQRSPENFHKIKQDQVESKWRTVQRNAEKFKKEGLNSIVVSNENVDIEDTVNWFKNLLMEGGDHNGLV